MKEGIHESQMVVNVEYGDWDTWHKYR